MTNWQHSTLDSSPVGRVDKSARCQTGAGQESKKQHSNDFRARPAVWLEPVLALKPPSPGLNHHGFAGCLPAHLRKMTTRWWGKWAREHSLISTLCSGYVRILHCDVMWCETHVNPHYLNPSRGPGKFKNTNEKMLRIFLYCRPVGSASCFPSSIAFRHINNERIFCSLFPSRVSCNNALQCVESEGSFSSLNAQSASLNLLGVARIMSRNIDIKMVLTFGSSSSHQLVGPYKEFMGRYYDDYYYDNLMWI